MKSAIIAISLGVIAIGLFVWAYWYVLSFLMDSRYYSYMYKQEVANKIAAKGCLDSWVSSDNVTHIGITIDGKQYELEVVE